MCRNVYEVHGFRCHIPVGKPIWPTGASDIFLKTSIDLTHAMLLRIGQRQEFSNDLRLGFLLHRRSRFDMDDLDRAGRLGRFRRFPLWGAGMKIVTRQVRGRWQFGRVQQDGLTYWYAGMHTTERNALRSAERRVSGYRMPHAEP